MWLFCRATVPLSFKKIDCAGGLIGTFILLSGLSHKGMGYILSFLAAQWAWHAFIGGSRNFEVSVALLAALQHQNT